GEGEVAIQGDDATSLNGGVRFEDLLDAEIGDGGLLIAGRIHARVGESAEDYQFGLGKLLSQRVLPQGAKAARTQLAARHGTAQQEKQEGKPAAGAGHDRPSSRALGASSRTIAAGLPG